MIYHETEEYIKNIQDHTRILGFDYGTKKIGVAVSDGRQKVATPSGTIVYDQIDDAIARIISILKNYNSNSIVFGWPLQMDGAEGELCQKVMDFVTILSEKTNCNILLYDERMSSSAAYSLLYDTELNRKQKDKITDKVAASFILQGVLDNLSNMRKGILEKAV